MCSDATELLPSCVTFWGGWNGWCHPSFLQDIGPSPRHCPSETLLVLPALGPELWREEVGQGKAGQEAQVADTPAILAPKI